MIIIIITDIHGFFPYCKYFNNKGLLLWIMTDLTDSIWLTKDAVKLVIIMIVFAVCLLIRLFFSAYYILILYLVSPLTTTTTTTFIDPLIHKKDEMYMQ